MDQSAAEAMIVRIFADGFNHGDFSGVSAHVAEDYIDHSPIPAPGPGPEGFAGRMGGLRAAFGELRIAIHEVSAVGDRVWFRWTMEGNHVGPFAGVEPTGRPMSIEGINLEVVDGDKIVEHFSQFDRATLLQQLKN
jgi:steroid delta-isomerase-like uncharacterized protein